MALLGVRLEATAAMVSEVIHIILTGYTYAGALDVFIWMSKKRHEYNLN
jgi:hypothetical protein